MNGMRVVQMAWFLLIFLSTAFVLLRRRHLLFGVPVVVSFSNASGCCFIYPTPCEPCALPESLRYKGCGSCCSWYYSTIYKKIVHTQQSFPRIGVVSCLVSRSMRSVYLYPPVVLCDSSVLLSSVFYRVVWSLGLLMIQIGPPSCVRACLHVCVCSARQGNDGNIRRFTINGLPDLDSGLFPK